MPVPVERCEALPRRAPLHMNEITRRIAPKPVAEVLEQCVIGIKHGGETDNTAVARVRSSKEPLNQNFVADFSAAEPYHVPFIKYNQSNIIKHRWVLTKSEIELFRCCNHNVRAHEGLRVDHRRAAGSVQRRNGSTQWNKGFC